MRVVYAWHYHRRNNMNDLLRAIINAAGVPGYENEIAKILYDELKKTCREVSIDNFGNVIARKGKGKNKIMLAAHMDEVGFVVKHISKIGRASCRERV